MYALCTNTRTQSIYYHQAFGKVPLGTHIALIRKPQRRKVVAAAASLVARFISPISNQRTKFPFHKIHILQLGYIRQHIFTHTNTAEQRCRHTHTRSSSRSFFSGGYMYPMHTFYVFSCFSAHSSNVSLSWYTSYICVFSFGGVRSVPARHR